MTQPCLHETERLARRVASMAGSRLAARLGAAALLLAYGLAGAQVITIDTRTGKQTAGDNSAPVDRRYQQIEPTHVPLSKSELDAKTRLELIRVLQSEQGFAMRPFPRGHKGLTLAANGKLEPAGEAYLKMVTSEGLSAKPSDRLVLSDLKFERDRIVFALNGGPDPKHRILRHVEIGAGPDTTHPVVQDDGQEATGARLTLTFDKRVPELTGSEVKALLAPLISFDVKTPIQAFTDTLPPALKEAIFNHRVLVGMSTEMVIFAVGRPELKTREMDGQMPYEEWIYGRPPQEVKFVRINGNRVIRLEIAKTGETPAIFTKDEVAGLMRTDGTSVFPAGDSNTRIAKTGDVERDPDTQAPAAPPSLRKPGETLPDDKKGEGAMKPVRFPAPKPADPPATAPASQPDSKPAAQPGANPDEEQPAPTPPVKDASQK
jgi:hypothetical protein